MNITVARIDHLSNLARLSPPGTRAAWSREFENMQRGETE